MNVEQLLKRCQTQSVIREFALEWIGQAINSKSETDFVESALGRLQAACSLVGIGIAAPQQGTWKLSAKVGHLSLLPTDLLAESLDQESLQSNSNWTAVPLETASRTPRVLIAAHGTADRLAAELPNTLDGAAALLALLLNLLEGEQVAQRRVARLTAILDIAVDWNQNRQMHRLLNQMAEASTRLLDAERASIFLWDRANKTLVGRPALGVDAEELRIAEDTGVVGQVVQSGEPRRIDEDAQREQAQIDRQVDEELGFTTRSLLCVPLRGSDGELFGAFEMVNKREGNFTTADEEALQELASHAAVALENTQEFEQLLKQRRELADDAARGVQLIGDSPAIRTLRQTVERVAQTDLAVLINGENGTGKEVVAQMAHYLSDRRHEPLVAVNCAAITETLLESELFGHEKGAFTDAREARAGKFEVAGNGTLFLDEIGDMSLGGQAKLLRVLEEKTVVRVGGSTPIRTNARVFAATNQDLAELVRQKRFREDLYYRLNVVTLQLPPLRERGEDVLLLAEYFLKDFSRKARRRTPRLTSAARKRLLTHSWPGNVRELRNMMERIAFLSADEKIEAENFEFILAPSPQSLDAVSWEHTLSDATRQFQIRMIERRISQAGGNMTLAAEQLGLHRSNLYRKMRQLGMSADDEEEAPQMQASLDG